MKNLSFTIVFFILLVSCNTNSNKNASEYDFIPEEASIIVIINDTESLETNLKNNGFINGLSKSSMYKNASKKLNHLALINTEHPIIISFLNDKNDSLQFTITTKQVPNIFETDSLSNHKIETLQIANTTAKKITFNKEKINIDKLKNSVSSTFFDKLKDDEKKEKLTKLEKKKYEECLENINVLIKRKIELSHILDIDSNKNLWISKKYKLAKKDINKKK